MINKLIIAILVLSLNTFAQVPTNGLVAFYPFSGNANDVSGHGYNGIVHGATLATDRFGISNSAYSFNGSSNYIDLSTYVTNLNFQNPASISFWVKTEYDVGQPIYCLGSANGYHFNGVFIGNNTTNTLNNELIIDSYCDTIADYYIAGFTTTNRSLLISSGWHHVVSVWNGISAVFYLDTNLLPLSCNWGANDGRYGNHPSAVTALLGANYVTSLGFYTFLHGLLDDVRIYNRALNASEVVQLYFDSTTSSGFSISATFATSTPSSVCQGSSVTLGISGGVLGTGANWYWYSGSCGGNYFVSGTNPVINPTASTVYYVRAQGNLNTTTCVSITVTINTLSSQASTATGISPICPGSISTLSINGGSLGTGGAWFWYSGTCGSTFIGTDALIVLTPPTTSIYYVRAEGPCNTTNCVSMTITFDLLSSSPTSGIANPSAICPGTSSTLSFTGGSLGTSASWKWYSLSCGVGLIGSNSSITQSPVQTSSYFVRGEGLCNTTGCISITLTIIPNSTGASHASAFSSMICPGIVDSLYSNGGSLSPGANWFWYTGGCGLVYIGTGATLAISPATSNTFYVRAESTCNTTSCVSVNINTYTFSVPVTSASSSSPICTGGLTTLSKTGGSLGTGAVWYWYTGGCGSNLLGINSIIFDSPTITTTYYIRAEGTCNTTACMSTTVVVFSQNSVQASSINATLPSLCTGIFDSLIAVGGVIAPGAIWHWYSGSCGGVTQGTGSSLVIFPTIAEVYYLRAEGACNSTPCTSIAIIINTAPLSPVLATTDRNNYCYNSGGHIILTVSGGNGDRLSWFNSSCGGTFFYTGNPDTLIAPSTGTEYWARWETNGCISSSCVSIYINVFLSPPAPVSVSSSLSSVCNNSTGTISLSDSGGIGTSFGWYIVSCGGTAIGTGNSLTIPSPSLTTTYWGRDETVSCGNSSCKSITVYVLSSPPQQPDSIVGNKQVVSGDTELYKVSYIPGSTYSWTIPSTWTGTSNTNSITLVAGSISGVISVISTNGCGTGPVRTLDISTFYSISGYFRYDSTNIPLDSVMVFLFRNGAKIDSVRANNFGSYRFDGLMNGTYNIEATTHKPWGGVNAVDALKVKRHFVGAELFTSSIRLHAADVNMSFTINTTDAVQIVRRFVGSDTSFIRGNWLFAKPYGGDTTDVSVYNNDTVAVSGHNVYQNFKGLCVGDVNADYLPPAGAKSEPKVIIECNGTAELNSNQEFDLPFVVNNDLSIGAISLLITYPSELVSVNNIQLENNTDLFYNMVGNEIRIGWYEINNAINIIKGQVLMNFTIKTSDKFSAGDIISFRIKNNPLCEFADENALPIDKVNLSTFEIKHSGSSNNNSIASPQSEDLAIYPNPSKGNFIIKFNSLPGTSCLKIYNTLGDIIVYKTININTLINNNQIEITDLQEGIYIIKWVGINRSICRMVVISK